MLVQKYLENSANYVEWYLVESDVREQKRSVFGQFCRFHVQNNFVVVDVKSPDFSGVLKGLIDENAILEHYIH